MYSIVQTGARLQQPPKYGRRLCFEEREMENMICIIPPLAAKA